MGRHQANLVAACAVAVLVTATDAAAFGMADIVNVGVQAGGKLIGAAFDAGVDKVKDALRDPEAEAAKKREEDRRFAEMLEKQIAQIEAQHDLTPLQREENVFALKNTYQQSQEFKRFAEMAEAQQRAQRDQIFTAGGLLGVVGEAVVNSPSVAVARADAMSRSPAYRAQVRSQDDALFSKVDAQMAARRDAMPTSAGALSNPNSELVAAAAVVMAVASQSFVNANAGAPPAGAASTVAAQSPPSVIEPAPTATSVMQAGDVLVAENAFTPDLGKKLYVEFAGSPTQTRRVRALLAAHGHILVEHRDVAEVAYLFDGAYTIPGNPLHEGVRLSVGSLLENPEQAIAVPEKKLMGNLQFGLAKLMLSAAKAQGAEVPQTGLPSETKGYRQQVLLMVARQLKGGAETRVSVVCQMDSESIVGSLLSKNANAELLGRLGIFAAEQAAAAPG